MTDTTLAGTSIVRWRDLGQRQASIEPQIDAVFFASSATQAFESEGARAAFRERWLGRYLTHFPEHVYVALAPGGEVAGYLVGSLSDPAETALFGDLPHFKAWRHLTRLYPAQLHINLGEAWRGQGLGRRLVDAFLRDARAAGAPGVHVVTAQGMRNVGFYLRAGFTEAGRQAFPGDRELLFLAQHLR